MNKKLFVVSGLLLVLLASSGVNAAPDGDQAPIGQSSSWAPYEDAPFWRGQVTHDMTSPKTNQFLGSYDGVAYDLASEFGLQIWEYDTLYDNSAANLTVAPHEVDFTTWNSTGLVREPESSANSGEWAETDSGSKLSTQIATANDKQYAPNALRLDFDMSTEGTNIAYLQTSYDVGISNSKYFVFGAYIVSETLNTTNYDFFVQLSDGTNEMKVTNKEGATNYAATNAGGDELVTFDMDTGDTVFFSAKISDWDSWDSTFSFDSVQTVTIYFNNGGYAATGEFVVDIFALEFLDSAPYFGDDEGDVISDSTTDHVLFNVSDPSSPDMTIVASEMSAKVNSIEDGTIDFVSFMTTDDPVLYDSTKRIEYTYDPIIDLDEDGTVSNAVTWSSLSARMMLGGSEADYLSIKWEGSESKSLVLNEERGDFITIAESLATDTYYKLEILIQYSSSEYNFIVSGNTEDEPDGLIGWIGVTVIGGVAALVGLFSRSGGKKVNKQKGRFTNRVNKGGSFSSRRRN